MLTFASYSVAKHVEIDWSNSDWCVINPQPVNAKPLLFKLTNVSVARPKTGLKPKERYKNDDRDLKIH